MSTTRDEAECIWLDRNIDRPADYDWAGRGEVHTKVEGDTVVLTWSEVDWNDNETEQRHVFHGTLAELREQIHDIELGG